MKPENWDKFLIDMAETYQVKGKPRKVFLQRFDYENWGKSDTEIKNISGVPSIETYKKHANTIYKQFSKDKPNGCPKLDPSDPGAGKFEILRTWLQETMYPQWLTEQKSEVSSSSPVDIDWREVCGKVLAQQREEQRLRRQATERGFELNVYVPLGLVERKQQQRRHGDVPLEEVYQLTEEVITKEYDNDKFLTEVIERGKSRRIAIIGEPGAGKTTLQEKIAVWIDKNNKGLPICIPLAGLQGKSLEDYLLQIWLKAALRFIEPDASGVEAQAFASLQKQFREGKVWLLLDGVDEMAATSPVEALAAIKEQLTDWLVEARVVLTCRLNVWDANVNNMLTGFETYRTLEFKPEQVEDFIRQWFVCAKESQQYCSDKTDLTPPAPLPYQGMGEPDSPLLAGEGQGERFACAEESQRGEELLKKLQETGKERIRELVRNPLRLSLLCQTSYLLPVDEPLPETKAALYERFTRYFYEWKQEQRPTTRTERRQLNQALGELAKAGINSALRFRLGEDLACDVMGEPLFDLACRLGWLNLVDREANTDEAVYAFYHPTFQEYFAACAIDDWRYFLNHDNENPHPLVNPNLSLEYDGGRPAYRIFEQRWKEVILLWLGRRDVEKEQKERFINALIEFEDGCKNFYWFLAYFLAAAGLAEFKDCSKADKIVAQVVKCMLGYFNIKNQEWQTFLSSIAEGARAAISATNRTKAIAALVELIQNSPDEYTRGLAISSLGKIGKDNSIAIAALVKLIHNSKSEYTRGQAADSLGKIGKDNPIALAALVELIQNAPFEYTRWQAADSLLAIDNDNPIALAALVELTQNSQSESTRLQAAESLGKIGKDNLMAITALVELIHNSPDKSIRLQAAESLGKIDKNNLIALATLVELIQNYQCESMRCRAADSVLKIDNDNPMAIAALVELIQNSQHKFTRKEAVHSLKSILAESQMAGVVTALKDYLLDETHENDFERYDDCYSVIWHCAQNMPYPDFYQAWHQMTIQ